jgi:hypothetical protein
MHIRIIKEKGKKKELNRKKKKRNEGLCFRDNRMP